MAFDLDPAYKQVPERIADLKETHPDARLRPVDPARPYWIELVGESIFIVYAAACYLTPDDPLPGIGIAWEPFPGRTPYTKDSELMNAETSAWGRAIVAALQSESKTIASAEDVRNRQADHASLQSKVEHVSTIQRNAPQRPSKPTNNAGRVYLTVPFASKDAAKMLGARWDKEAPQPESDKLGRWYIPEGANPVPFTAWLDPRDGSTEAIVAALLPDDEPPPYSDDEMQPF